MAIPVQMPGLAHMAQVPMGLELPDPAGMGWGDFMNQMSARMAQAQQAQRAHPGQPRQGPARPPNAPPGACDAGPWCVCVCVCVCARARARVCGGGRGWLCRHADGHFIHMLMWDGIKAYGGHGVKRQGSRGCL